jgi:hypothetical protein
METESSNLALMSDLQSFVAWLRELMARVAEALRPLAEAIAEIARDITKVVAAVDAALRQPENQDWMNALRFIAAFMAAGQEVQAPPCRPPVYYL